MNADQRGKTRLTTEFHATSKKVKKIFMHLLQLDVNTCVDAGLVVIWNIFDNNGLLQRRTLY